MFQDISAAMDNGDNRAHLVGRFINDAVGPIEEFSDGLIAEFGDHTAQQGGLLKYARRLNYAYAESLGIDNGVFGNILNNVLKIV
jgi:hypothetical protein